MRSSICFGRMRVEHKQIGSYLCHNVALTNSGDTVVNRYFFNQILNQLKDLVHVFISNQVAKSLTLKMLSNLLRNLQRSKR